jgi:hypothetical protein
MKASKVRNEIVDRFGCLVRCGDLKIEADDNTLTLSGKISAVEAMHDHVMQGHMPNDCKQIMEYQSLKLKTAYYTYRF